VAAEIKALADQSKKATTQVRQILGESRRATNAAVMATEQGTKSVSDAIKTVSEAGTTIRMLADIIGTRRAVGGANRGFVRTAGDGHAPDPSGDAEHQPGEYADISRPPASPSRRRNISPFSAPA